MRALVLPPPESSRHAARRPARRRHARSWPPQPSFSPRNFSWTSHWPRRSSRACQTPAQSPSSSGSRTCNRASAQEARGRKTRSPAGSRPCARRAANSQLARQQQTCRGVCGLGQPRPVHPGLQLQPGPDSEGYFSQDRREDRGHGRGRAHLWQLRTRPCPRCAHTSFSTAPATTFF